MTFKTSSDGTIENAANRHLSSKGGIPAMYGTGDYTTLPSNKLKITVSDGAVNDYFGTSVAVGSGRIVVSSVYDDDAGDNSGSAYVFDLDGNPLTKLIASDGAAGDQFGNSVAIGCGRIFVGSRLDDDNGSSSGSAYIFDLNGNQLAKIKPSDGAAGDQFGYSVAVGSGRIVVGSRQDDDNGTDSGSAYIFELDGDQLAKLVPSDGASGDWFGSSVAVGSNRIVVGASGDSDNGTYSGSAYIYDIDGNQLTKLVPSDGAANDYFGYSVAIGSDIIVVGSVGAESVYMYDLDGNFITKITSSDNDDYVYQFGYSLAVGNGRIVAGARGLKERIYIFDLNGNKLDKIISDADSNLDNFGSSVAVGSGRIVVGASGDSDNGSYSGSAYIYETPEVITPYDVQDWERG